MASTAPADADLLDDADTETTANAADRSGTPSLFATGADNCLHDHLAVTGQSSCSMI